MSADIQAVRDLHAARRSARLQEIHWIDAAYQVYLTAIFATVAVITVANLIGEGKVSAAAAARVHDHGPSVLGAIVTLIAVAGLRSGSRGGPIALEAAEVRYVLLAPIDRGAVLRRAAFRQLRFAAFAGTVAGAVAAAFAQKRFPGEPVAWIASGALFGLVTAVLNVGCALTASGHRIHRAATTAMGIVLLGWAGVAAWVGNAGPADSIARVALWPLGFSWVPLVAIVFVVALAATGLRSVGGTSLEATERRTSLVGQLRFAVTMQDLRTVLVLRRQLAQDLPRSRPWIKVRKAFRRFPVWRRDLHGFLRFPAPRLARMVALCVIAAFAVRGVWEGTTPLIAIAAIAIYLAGLDIVEPLAQQVDQADLTDLTPRHEGDLYQRHLALSTLMMVLFCAIAYGIVVAVIPSSRAVEVGAVLVLPAALGAVAAATITVVRSAPDPSKTGAMMPPEFAGAQVVMRNVWPLIVAGLGVMPIAFARHQFDKGFDPIGGAIMASIAGVAVAALTVAWVRFREEAHAWFARAMDASANAKKPTATPSTPGSR